MRKRQENKGKTERLGISYRRFSDPQQRKGRSAARQIRRAERWALRNSIVIDPALSMLDEGLSGYWGDHRMKGALGRFVKLCGTERVPPGSVLIIEDFDRLSRENPDDAWELFREILLTGVEIAVLSLGRWFKRESLNSFEDRVLVQASQHKAHAESKVKAERLEDVWRARRKRARKGKPTFTVVPSWCQKTKRRKVVLREDRVQTIREMIRLHETGLGVDRIAQALSQDPERFPCWARSGQWRGELVHHILTSPALWGAYQPRRYGEGRKLEAIGRILPGIYPAVCTQEEAERIQTRLTARKAERGRPAMVRGNALLRLVRDSETGSKVGLCTGYIRKDGTPHVYLERKVGGARKILLDYYTAERMILQMVQQWTPEDVGQDKTDNRKADALRKSLREIEERTEAIRLALKGAKPATVAALVGVLEELATEEQKARDALSREETPASPASATLKQAQSLAKMLADCEESERPSIRQRVNRLLKDLLQGVWLYRQEVGVRRAAVYIQVWTRGGVSAYGVAMVGKPPAGWVPLDLAGVDFREGNPVGR